MSLFEDFLSAQLGPDVDFEIGHDPQGFTTIGHESGVKVALEPEGLFLSGDDDEGGALGPLLIFGASLRKIHDFLDRFPLRIQLDTERRASVELEAPSELPVWSERGLHASVNLIQYVKRGDSEAQDEITDVQQGECRILPAEALRDDWAALLAAFDARLASATKEDLTIEIASLIPPAKHPDPAWDTWSATLDLEGIPARVDRALQRVAAISPAVRARYAELYALPLPGWLDQLAALVIALGDLPSNPETLHWQPEPGWERGSGWLTAAFGMSASGLLEWYLPGGLDRETLDASVLYDPIPPGREGPLDPRLDMRYRADAPQFITFLGGDSDGLHWGLWYDSPDYYPVIAHNYARDSAETWLDGDDLFPWLQEKIAQATTEAAAETLSYEDNAELRPYALGHWRALRVLDLHLAELSRRASETPTSEPKCLWPRTEGHPIGSPRLALRPGSGAIPEHIPGFSNEERRPTPEQRRGWMAEARRDLAAGHTASALALGLYLHWLDSDDLREEAGQLLLDAYAAAGFGPFAGILRAHLLHRDLRSVAVFKS